MIGEGNHSPLLEEQRKQRCIKPSWHNPTLHPRKSVCHDPFGAHQTNLPHPPSQWTCWFHCGTKYNWTNFRNSSNRRNLISLPTLPLSTSKLPLTQCPVIPCVQFYKSVAFHRNFLSLCVNCTQTPEAVRLASSLSEEFSIETGVMQGCVIAPDLFNCVIDHLMRRLLRRCSLGIQLGEYQLTDLDYADDIAIFAPPACVLQEALTILQGCKSAGRRQNSWLSPQPH